MKQYNTNEMKSSGLALKQKLWRTELSNEACLLLLLVGVAAILQLSLFEERVAAVDLIGVEATLEVALLFSNLKEETGGFFLLTEGKIS
ncbi:hypothetical protein Ahy_A10g047178 isoform B [Arachis hypogaea]|uniref:Uncharacterized protein n=1 Tax=Arachis hypogaea TaxID=3818 RepID=A0A445B1T6_ARAHY|nr:hypothetical protein Ahy_A10g047178 isoform B [Arachis hypogaea]